MTQVEQLTLERAFGRLEEKVDALQTDLTEARRDMREHVTSHLSDRVRAEDAQQTAKQAALLVAISHRSNRIAIVAALIAGGVLTVVQLAELVRLLAGH